MKRSGRLIWTEREAAMATEQPAKRRQMGQKEYLQERGTCCPWCRKSKIDPKTQIKNLDEIVDLTVASVATGECGDWGDISESIVISFDNDTFVIIRARLNWTEGADAIVETETPQSSEFLVDAGVFTQEEHESRLTAERKKRDEANRESELRHLERLEAKYR